MATPPLNLATFAPTAQLPTPHAALTPPATLAVPVASPPGAAQPTARAPTAKAQVSFARARMNLIDAALAHQATREWIMPERHDSDRGKSAMLYDALRAFGCRFDEHGQYELSDAPEHNRFERLRSDLNAEHAAAMGALRSACQQQLTTDATALQGYQEKLAVLEAELAAATKERDAAQLETLKLATVRSPAADRARDAEARAAEAEAALAAERARADGLAKLQRQTESKCSQQLCEKQRMQAQIDALSQTASRSELRAQQEAARRRDAAAAAEREEQLSRQIEELVTAGREACCTIQQLEAKVRSEQTRRGLVAAELETATLKLQKLEPPTQDTTVRNQERREAAQWKEIDAARAEISQLRERVQQLQQAAPAARGHQVQTISLQPVRTGDSDCAPLTGRSVEYLRRLVDESNGSFEGAATSNAIILGLHFGADHVPDSRLVSAATIRNAFFRAGLADQERDAERNANDTGPWCIAQDAGGGTLMVATGHWDAEQQQPVARPLAAADLYRDQGARNGINTLERAARRGGLAFERLVASCSDGTDHAVHESQGFCERAHELGARAQSGRTQTGQADFCCIHGKALEENGGMQASFPDNFLVDALRLLWEIVGGPEGRPAHYRKIWAMEVKRIDGIKLPPLPVQLFDQNLKPMPEPTEAKWQVNAHLPHDPPSPVAHAARLNSNCATQLELCGWWSLRGELTLSCQPVRIATGHVRYVLLPLDAAGAVWRPAPRGCAALLPGDLLREVPGALLRQHRPGEGEARRSPAHGEAAAAQRHLRKAKCLRRHLHHH